MKEENIKSNWTFNSNINWIRELARLIESITKDAPDIVIRTMRDETLFQYLFVICDINKNHILRLKNAKDLNELMNIIYSNKAIRENKKDAYYSNNYELDKTLTTNLLKSELESLRIKCENISFKSEIKTIKNDYSFINRELEIAHNKLKDRTKNRIKEIKQKNDTKKARIEFIAKAIDNFEPKLKNAAEKCRFKNGKINFSKLGKQFGVDHKTAQNWCKRYAIKFHLT